MTSTLRRLTRAVAGTAYDTRPEFRRIDASPALYDNGAWLKPLV
jgi:hypothetical protein